jgi:heme/copper-type cytochrome/quinol oxidase subunit 4
MIPSDNEKLNSILVVFLFLIMSTIPLYLAYANGLISLAMSIGYVIIVSCIVILIGLFYYLY